MGFGPFEDWEFITSGMHAVLAFARSCDSLNLYGFTTDVGAKVGNGPTTQHSAFVGDVCAPPLCAGCVTFV
jgi:hypothetical protein